MSPNPTHLKNEFAHRFIRSLNNINSIKRSSNANKISLRSRRVAIAAYTTMASIVGSKRAWSCAVLRKIRNRSRNKGLLVRKKIKLDHKFGINFHHHAKVHLKKRNRIPKREDFDIFKNSGQELKLRKLVPGGETMNSWCLMGETADYIKCLAAQVEVMKTLVNLYTAI
ncbi:transcription factor IBH1-like [Rutidosis leptorrhynchoides]|uniref:transcription factor IBH1-like n=1 Tax=Rutidosis leptorrhynchoides TaxID=125765 RepID=UPI003A997A12